MKKYLAFILACMMIFGCNIQSHAAEIETQNMMAIVEDEERNTKIDQLFQVRCGLELEYEKNEVLIDQIDKQLKSLGVEEITVDEVRSKMGQNVMPCVSVSSTSTTTWTSRRLVVAYANKQYELQIIEGVPTSQSSPLRKDDCEAPYKKSGFVAGAVNAMKVVGVSALGAVPDIGTTLSVGMTAYDAFKSYMSGITPNTVIENVQGVALVSFTSHMKYIYVKPNGSTDLGNQVLCYAGSMVDYVVTTTSVVDRLVNGVSTPIHNVEAMKQDSSTSKNYSNYTLPAQNYYNYKTNGNSNFVYDYHITYVTLNLFGQNARFTAPSEYPNIS